MPSHAWQLYAGAFLERIRPCDGHLIRRPGLLGAASANGAISLLVSDDRARDALSEIIPAARTGSIRVLAPALRCTSLIRELLPWKSDSVTAMVCGDLREVPSLALDPGLTVQQVERVADDPPGGVPLVGAATLALAAAPDIELSQAQFVAFLRALPTAFRLFAAVDNAGAVRATSGAGVFGAYARVIFVDTDPNWRNRGIGTAMTAYALKAAHRAGAHRASLDASSAARSIYLRLGFKEAGRVTRFHQNA